MVNLYYSRFQPLASSTLHGDQGLRSDAGTQLRIGNFREQGSVLYTLGIDHENMRLAAPSGDCRLL